jgi:hypothetical protein
MSGIYQKRRVIADIDPDDFLRCSRCKEWKPAAAGFNPMRPKGTGYHSNCKQCFNSRKGHGKDGQGYGEWGGAESKATEMLNRARHPTGRRQHRASPELEAARARVRELECRERPEPQEAGHVYLLLEEGGAAVKIGWSQTAPQARVSECQTGNPRIIRYITSRPGSEDDERALHRKFAWAQPAHFVGEWFQPVPEIFREFGLLTEDSRDAIVPTIDNPQEDRTNP